MKILNMLMGRKGIEVKDDEISWKRNEIYSPKKEIYLPYAEEIK